MKQMIKSSTPSLCLRICLLVYIVSTPSLQEIDEHDWNRALYAEERSDSIKSSKKSAISPHRCKDKIDGSRNYSKNESIINDEKNSVALNRFLEDVLNAQDDLKWIDYATRNINRRTRSDDQLTRTNQYSTVSDNTGDVLERADIGYGSRLRGKRGFDRNYDMMWMLQKKKYRQKSTRDVPQRVYLDNDMTFKKDDNADFDAPYQFRGTLNRAIYDREAIADQPLKDWIRKKDLHSSGDWSNSNENPKVTNGKSIYPRGDYEHAREIPVNSDSNKDEKLHVDADTRGQLEVVSSLREPINANDFTVLRGSVIRNKTRNALESLKKTVLKLRNSLLGYKRKDIISRRESDWWNEPRSTVEIYDFGKDLDGHPNEEIIRRLKRAKNVNNEDEGDSRIFQGIEESYFGKQNSKDSHDRSKRSRNFVADSTYANNERNIQENNRRAQMIRNIFKNVTTQNTKEATMKLYSDYFSDDGKKLRNTSNKTNISDSQYSLDKKISLNNHFNNSTIIPSIANKTNFSGLKYPSNTELYLNNYFDNKSLFVIKTNLQTHSLESINKSENATNSKEINQQSIEILKNIYTTENHTNPSDFEKNIFTVSNINDGADDSGKFLKNRTDEEKLGVVAQKITRLDMNDGQLKNAKKEFPWRNTSRGFGITTNELWSCVETTVRRKEIGGTRERNREPIPGVIKVFEPRGRPYQKQEAETAARLSRRMGKDEISVAKMKTNEDEAGKSKSTNAREDSSTMPIDSVTDTTMMKPEAPYINTSETDKSIILKDLTSVIVDNDLRKQQQMVPFLSAENKNANRSNGNLDNRIDIRILRSNGNETINVKEDTRTMTEAHEYHKSDNNLQRKLLWISTISVDGKTEDSSSTRSVFNTTIEDGIENVTNENRQQNEIISSANLRKVTTSNEDKIEKSHMLQDALYSQISETNHYARHKRSVYPYENLDSNNEADSENIAIEKEAAMNHVEKQESNEDYLNQDVDELKGSYNDREEDIFEDDDKAMESKGEGQSSLRQQIDPIRAKVDMLIKQKLDKKHKGSDIDRKKRHSRLDMIEYYDYDDDEEQERDAPINEQETQNKDNKLDVKIRKRAGEPSCKPGNLGKKKNENAEAVMREQRRKAQAKNKEPKEEIVIDLGKRKNKMNDRNKKKTFGSLGSSFENVFNEERQLSAKENSDKIRQSKDFENNVQHEESAAVKSKWLDQPFEDDRMALSKTNSESSLEDSCKKKTNLNEPLEYMANVNVNPNVIKNILLDIQPVKIMEQSKELEAPKDFYEDFEDDRPDDYYYQENDSNIESQYDEELKNVYDWPNSELKSGLRSNQRLRYESDDTNPSQLQPLNGRILDIGQSIDASWMIVDSNSTLASSYFALKVTDDMFKGDFEQSSTEKTSPNIFSIKTTTDSRVSTISEDKNIPFLEGRSISDTDSGSPYENSKYIESKTHEILKRNLNLGKQAAINSQDLQESFVESLDWYNDFDDNVKVRLGRGLKAMNETVISGFNETYNNHENKLDIIVANATNVKPIRVSSQTSHDKSMSQNWHNNTIMDLYNIFNNHPGVSEQSAKNVQESILMNTVNGDEDLEAAEQKYVNNQTPRIRRAAVSYHTFYDDLNQNQRDSDEMDGSLDNQFRSPNINLKNRFDGAYRGYETGNWNNDIRDFDRYSKVPLTNTRKKGRSGKRSKKNKHSSEKGARKSNWHSSSSRNRRYHAHRSDTSKNVNRSDLKPKRKNKAEASSSIGRTSIQKSKTVEQGLLRAGMNEGKKVLYENVENQSTVKPEENENDARRKEIALLLAADNIDDESQMDMALHGELAGKIVEQIFQQVKKHDQLKSVFGPGLHRDHKTEDVITDNTYQQRLDENGTNHTEMMINRVMGLLGTLILNEVQKKACISLSPDTREFLGWMLEVDREEESLEEAPPLPLVREKIIPEQDAGRKFLFDSTAEQEEEENINDLQKKVRVLETLVKEYNALTAKEKTRVQTVHDYLVQQLNLLLQYIEVREAAEKKGKPASVSIGAGRAGSGNILQYQSAVSNATNAGHLVTKDAFSLPTDTNNLFQFNNVSSETTGHAASRHRETRSLDKIPSKRHRKTKRQKSRNRKKKENQRKSKRRRNKHHRHLNRAGSSSGYRKSRQKRANLEENRASLYYLGYEKPRIYDSFDLLDAKLRGKKKRKRELVDKKNTTIENRMPDLLPIKGKNRMEDEVMLLNKREAWKRENEKQLEEVAFGKDMRNSTRRDRERFERLTEGDKRKPINETSSRMKRENIIRGGTSTGNGTVYSNESRAAAFEIRDGKSWNNSEINNDNGINENENKLELAERRINVFADNKTNVAADSAAAEVSLEEKPATNAGTNNRVEGKLGAVNRAAKIDATNVGRAGLVNLMSDAKPRVSKERRKVSVTEKEADNAAKLNRATNYRREETDPEIGLKNLRRGREEGIYDVADWKMTDYLYDDDKLSRSELREKYAAKLDGLGDLDTEPENNLALLRLRNNKWSNDVVEWRLLPVIKRSPYYDYRALSRVGLMGKETPILSNIKDAESESDAYLSGPRYSQLIHRRRNNIFNISPVLRITDNFPRRIHRKAKRRSEKERRFKNSDPKITFNVRRLLRRKNDGKSTGIVEFGMPFVLKARPNREFREIPRGLHPELDDRVIYDGAGLQLPSWPYQYYDDFADSSIFRFAPGIRGRGDDVYRYPAETYLEYGPFKKRRAHDAKRRFATGRNRFRPGTSERENGVDFPGDNLASESSKPGFARRKPRVETDESALASGEDRLVSGETRKYTREKETNETTTRSTK